MNKAINYNEKQLVFVNYGRKITTRPTERPSKANIHHLHKTILKCSNKAKIALCGASIINGLQRYPDVWDNFFAPLVAINFGIGGDKVQNILWRIEDMEFPPVEYLFLHCGTNNMRSSSPKDIADGILSIGVMAKKQQAELKVVIGGLLHCDQDELPTRSIVAEANKILRRKVHNLDDFYFMEEDDDWLNGDGSLNMELYYEDCIHLNHNGNEKFANTIIRKLKDIESSSPSCSSGIILGIPSSEAPQKVTRGV